MTSRWIMNMNWWFPKPKPSPPEDKTPSTRKGFRVIAEDEDGAADLARARSEAARGRRERAIWPKIDVTISADGSTTGRSFRSDDLISRALELLPLESEADARAFRERLRSTSAILGSSALCAHPDGRGRSMLWYAVDAEDLRAGLRRGLRRGRRAPRPRGAARCEPARARRRPRAPRRRGRAPARGGDDSALRRRRL